jgi:hypothetical protein
MNSLVQFVLQRILTRSFWLMVITTFLGILMYDQRSTFKDQIFQEAIASSQKSGWKNWNPKTPFDRD